MKKTLKTLLLTLVIFAFLFTTLSCDEKNEDTETSVDVLEITEETEYKKIHENEYYVYSSHTDANKCVLSLKPDFKAALENNVEYVVNGEILWTPETPLPSFETNFAKVASLADIFENSTVENLDLSLWNANYITDISSAFKGCSALSVLDLSGLDTSRITEYEETFSNCPQLKTLLVKTPFDKTLIEKSITASELFSENCTVTVLTSVRWIAIGDSITQGYYSNNDGTYSKTDTNGWVVHVAASTGMQLENKGVGGTGFVDVKSKYDAINGRTIVDDIDFANYDLVTIGYGTNDWRNYKKLGTFNDDLKTGGTVYSNMRYIIEKILNDNPECKIVVITPLNCWEHGNYENNWAIGHKFDATQNSLGDIYNAEKEICEYYGIKMIDMTYNSFINRDNIQNYLLDKLHPSIECYELLGKELAHKIKFLL